jgi:hypothetical protein
MAASHNAYGAGSRLQQPPSPTLRRGNSYGGTSADPTPLASPPARSPSSRSFDMARLASSRPAHLEEVLDMDVGSFHVPSLRRSPSAGSAGGPSRGNTLKRGKSASRGSSGSPRSARAGSIPDVAFDKRNAVDQNDVFYMPIPTNGSPTELLATRFQGMSCLICSCAVAYSYSLENISERTYWLLQGGPVVVRAAV